MCVYVCMYVYVRVDVGVYVWARRETGRIFECQSGGPGEWE